MRACWWRDTFYKNSNSITHENVIAADVAQSSRRAPPRLKTPSNTVDVSHFQSVDSAVADYSRAASFSDSFYAVLLQNTDNGPTVHMWIVTLSSASPLSANAPHVQRRMLVSTSKVIETVLPMPSPNMRVQAACASAGHLASASLYPACRTPYALVTASEDDTLR